MIKRLSILLFLLSGYCFVNSAFSQNKIDSLYNVIKTSKPGKDLVSTLIVFSDECSYINPELSLKSAYAALLLAKKLSFTQGIAKCYSIIGKIYIITGDFSKSLEYADAALKILESGKDYKQIAYCYTIKGLAYSKLSNYVKELEYTQKSTIIHENMHDKEGMSVCYNNLGVFYKNQGNPDMALYYYNKSLAIDRELNKTYEIAATYINIGNILNRKGRLDEALKYYIKAGNLFNEYGDKFGTATAYCNIGANYMRKKEYNYAIYYVKKSYKLFNEIGSKNETAKSLNSLAEIYLSQKKFDAALSCSKKALTISKEIGVLSELQDAYYTLSIINDSIKNYKDALEYHILYSEIKDSVINIESKKKIIELQTKYDVENKDKKIEIQQLNLDKQNLLINRKNYFIYGIIIISLLLIVIILSLFRQYQLTSKKSKIELQQKLLRTQMNPHFMFNSLLSIQSFMYENNPETAVLYLSRFADLMRLILENSREEYITLNKEVKTLENYMELQKMRFENTFNYSIFIDPLLHKDFVYVPPMLAQPFIENAIEHGLAGKKSDGLVEITFKLINNYILFEIQDNGIGYLNREKEKSNDKKKHKSLALEITKERLYCLNKKSFRKKIKFEIIDLGVISNGKSSGTKVVFNIPFYNETA